MIQLTIDLTTEEFKELAAAIDKLSELVGKRLTTEETISLMSKIITHEQAKKHPRMQSRISDHHLNRQGSFV